jgi:hypothetical protein
MVQVAAVIVLAYAAIIAVVELHDPVWPWWKTSLTLAGLCVLVFVLLVADRRLL